ncbi:hypothetical protein [Polaromonas eurypsychrophila]|uniref:hypothetical protein n=1 Tax=Polaromonas eurypsychrophila TaxID=1614635 RepID=UPI001667E6F3|nr:hypothetical protein [Polaromonas eurypsychrophila]
MNKLTLNRLNNHVYLVLSNQGEHVGNLKLISGVWKFKAIGYDPNGDVIPGGGPLTDRHNTTFVALDEALVSASLAPT